MVALRSGSGDPAQFVFDRGQLGGPGGLLAFVVSASTDERDTLQRQVLQQAADQLGMNDLQPVMTVVERRATFACTPGLTRPGMLVAPGLLACGDYVEGLYPSTIEGAVRSGLNAARSIDNGHRSASDPPERPTSPTAGCAPPSPSARPRGAP